MTSLLICRQKFQIWSCADRNCARGCDTPTPPVGTGLQPVPSQVNRNEKGIAIASINVNGLVKHIDEIKLLLIEKNIHILAINETKLDETIEDNIISIDKY